MSPTLLSFSPRLSFKGKRVQSTKRCYLQPHQLPVLPLRAKVHLWKGKMSRGISHHPQKHSAKGNGRRRSPLRRERGFFCTFEGRGRWGQCIMISPLFFSRCRRRCDAQKHRCVPAAAIYFLCAFGERGFGVAYVYVQSCTYRGGIHVSFLLGGKRWEPGMSLNDAEEGKSSVLSASGKRE